MNHAVTRFMGRLRAVGVLGLLLAITHQPAVEAHAAGNTPASNYVSRVLSVTPKSAAFSATVIEAGNRVEVTWRSGPELLIEDYDGYPYLCVGPSGGYENRQSNAVYLNADRQGGTLVPEGLRPDGPPDWQQISSAPVVRFHDHRVHWMGQSPPPQVQQATGRTHLIQRWEIPISQDSTAFNIAGDLRWVPGPSPLMPLLGAGAVGVAAVAGIVIAANRNRPSQSLRAFSVLLGLLVVVDAVHLFGIAYGVRGGSGMGRVVSIGWVSLCAWMLAAATIGALARRRLDALYVGVFAAGIITLVGGLSDLSVLSSSSVPFAFANSIARASIALTLGLGIATVIAGVILTGRGTSQSRADTLAAGNPDTVAELATGRDGVSPAPPT